MDDATIERARKLVEHRLRRYRQDVDANIGKINAYDQDIILDIAEIIESHDELQRAHNIRRKAYGDLLRTLRLLKKHIDKALT